VAFVTTTRTGATLEECDQICGPSADCSEACLHIPPDPYPGFETTCGEYDDGASNGWCYDPQACGDGLCDNINDNEDADNCSEDCGDPLSTGPTCEANGCELGESCWSCPQDCGDCGDDGNPDPDDGECTENESHSSDECLIPYDRCDNDQDCASYHGQYGFVCVDKRCTARDVPSFVSPCDGPEDCASGWRCTISEKLQGDGCYFLSGGILVPCPVCHPPWLVD
jgi:hypothetical protein